jgi:MoxR-like ATPase
MVANKPLLIERLVTIFKGPSPSPSALESATELRDPGLPWRLAFRKAENYIVSDALDRAAYVALLLGQPLLLTGEPGAGKSDFARKLAQIFELGDVQEIHVKTTTLGRDLLYSFDDIARFRDATAKGSADSSKSSRPLSEYVRLNGLGRAILRSAGPKGRVSPVGRELDEIYRGTELPDGDGHISLGALFPAEFGQFNGKPATITASIRSVVLIDEIDKAQRDTPNDLLDEIERMQFDIPELGITIKASEKVWPIVVITSNQERVLPPPFLRRCVFHRLDTPEDPATLHQILAARLTEEFSRGSMANDALDIFLGLRKNPGQRAPGISELLAWCLLLQRLEFKLSAPLPREGERFELLEASLAALSKSDADFEAAKRVLSQWKAGQLLSSGAGQR